MQNIALSFFRSKREEERHGDRANKKLMYLCVCDCVVNKKLWVRLFVFCVNFCTEKLFYKQSFVHLPDEHSANNTDSTTTKTERCQTSSDAPSNQQV
jgi:hypothetical protein